METVVKPRLRIDDDWLTTVLFRKLPPGLDDGETTSLWRWAQVAGVSFEAARKLAKAGKVPGYVATKRGRQRKPRELVRIDRATWDRWGLLAALGLPQSPWEIESRR